jgi:hypothetical protein
MAEFGPALDNRDGMLRAEIVQMAELITPVEEINEHAFHHDAPLSASLGTHCPLGASCNGATSVQEHAQFPQQLRKPPSVARAVTGLSFVATFEPPALEHVHDSLAGLVPFRLSSSHM